MNADGGGFEIAHFNSYPAPGCLFWFPGALVVGMLPPPAPAFWRRVIRNVRIIRIADHAE
jgi:hypothetical protein